MVCSFCPEQTKLSLGSEGTVTRGGLGIEQFNALQRAGLHVGAGRAPSLTQVDEFSAASVSALNCRRGPQLLTTSRQIPTFLSPCRVLRCIFSSLVEFCSRYQPPSSCEDLLDIIPPPCWPGSCSHCNKFVASWLFLSSLFIFLSFVLESV